MRFFDKMMQKNEFIILPIKEKYTVSQRPQFPYFAVNMLYIGNADSCAVTCKSTTGGIAYGEDVVAKLKERCGWIAPVTVYPGEDELLALAQGALRVMNGEEQVKQY